MTGAGQVDGPVATPDYRTCTCHPDDKPPGPCPKKYALQDCRYAALLLEVEGLKAALQFARSEAITARGVLLTKADVVEVAPYGARHAQQLRRSAEKLGEVVRSSDAALSPASGGV